jgi:hypothetical protein
MASIDAMSVRAIVTVELSLVLTTTPSARASTIVPTMLVPSLFTTLLGAESRLHANPTIAAETMAAT